MKKNIIKYVITAVITAVLTAVITLCCLQVYFYRLPLSVDSIIKVAKIIERSYIGDYSPEKMQKYALSAIVSSIGDEYAAYYDADAAQDTMEKLEGHYIGIGLEVFSNTEKNKIEVISVYKDSPSDKAGIQKGDYIIEIDDKKYGAYDLEDAVSYMKGVNEKSPLEKEIQIVVERNGKHIKLSLKREEIELHKVESKILDGICYIKLSGFSQESVKSVEKILKEIDESKTEGIVFDIRNNPGGVFSSAIKLCDMFLEDGTIMYAMDKQGNKEIYKASKGACNLPMAVLINGSSASASEIFAGSMQDNKRAILVGEKTFGKGVSQTIQYLNNANQSEGALKLTTGKNFTPNGKWINEAIEPDIKVDEVKTGTELTEDNVFLAAVDSIKKGK